MTHLRVTGMKRTFHGRPPVEALAGVTVAVDAAGSAVHITGPTEWRIKIGKIPLTKA